MAPGADVILVLKAVAGAPTFVLIDNKVVAGLFAAGHSF
jgi:hypothetical protein